MAGTSCALLARHPTITLLGCGTNGMDRTRRTYPETVLAMRLSRIGSLGAMSATIMVVIACSSASRPGVQTAAAPESSDQGEEGAIKKARADSATHPYTQADIEFMTGMIGHHAQAIEMAGWAPTHGASPVGATLCERIINAQRDEIRTMQPWLRDRTSPCLSPIRPA